jgi:RNA-directed DNA polymerase
LRMAIEPIFENRFHPHSYGFRPGRGCKDALRRVEELLRAGRTHIVDVDIKGYFDAIPHDRLLAMVRERIADGRVLGLIEGFLKQGVMEGAELAKVVEDMPEDEPQGTPQGGVISPLLSNIYLDPLDHLMEEQGFEMVRYADDLVILCRTLDEAEHALEQVRKWTAENGLTLHPEKTHIADTEGEGFEFLGYLIKREHRWPRKKSLQKFKDTLRQKTKRTSGRSMYAIIADINRTLRGWFEYFKHSHHWIFGSLDSWIRMRLRSILRRRSHRRGCGRGLDHQLYPNAYFHDAGLFSLKAAWNRTVIPVAGNQ